MDKIFSFSWLMFNFCLSAFFQLILELLVVLCGFWIRKKIFFFWHLFGLQMLYMFNFCWLFFFVRKEKTMLFIMWCYTVIDVIFYLRENCILELGAMLPVIILSFVWIDDEDYRSLVFHAVLAFDLKKKNQVLQWSGLLACRYAI